MPTYIALATWTQDGMSQVKDSPARLDAVKKMYEEAGARITAFYMTMGQHDMVVVAEAPDDETVARLALRIGSTGSVRTQSMKAFTEDEYRDVIASLP
jgi:uncharacterized protein with GYD domain